MKKNKSKPPRNQQTTLMIARTSEGDPVWQTDGKGRPFLISHEDGQTIIPLGLLWWYRWWPVKGRVRMLEEPYLTWTQVSVANEKATTILKALRNGPIYLQKGFLKSRNGKILTTKAITHTVLHWMKGCGFVFTEQDLKGKRIRIDLDAEATAKNKVL